MNTPQRKTRHPQIMGTPLFIPPSPLLKTLGYGTGVDVYRIERSPKFGSIRSPWAAKCVSKRNLNTENGLLYGKRIADEASILRQLNHPNIVGFRAMKLTSDGRPTLVMEDCEISLGNILEDRNEEALGPLESIKITKVCQNILSALDYLHTKEHILHGDLKSFNILVKNNFEVCKLCDFGVSQQLNEEGFIDVVKYPNTTYVGTQLWSAPEVLKSDNLANISTKADIFSFGLIIYECIALIPPHTLGMCDNGSDDEADKSIISIKSSEPSFIEINSSQEEHDDEEENEDEEENDSLFGTRPLLPEASSLGNDYNTVIEIFFVCTNAEPEERPSASYLSQLLADKNSC